MPQLKKTDELLKKALKYKSYWGKDLNHGGVTVSGGEPLLQIDFLIDLFTLAKERDIHTCIDTSGVTYRPGNTAYIEKLDKLMDEKIEELDEVKEQMKKKLKKQEELLNSKVEESNILQKTTIKELIAPSGIDASNIDHLEIISNMKRYARSFFISGLPRMCTFPELLRDMYMFGDINTSIYISPVAESRSQTELNRVINELETERILAMDRGNINRESSVSQKRLEAEELRDEIAAGFNKLYEASIISTIFAYNESDKNNIFANNAESFYNAEQEYQINGIFLAAIGIHESAWGTSQIAKNKNSE